MSSLISKKHAKEGNVEEHGKKQREPEDQILIVQFPMRAYNELCGLLHSLDNDDGGGGQTIDQAVGLLRRHPSLVALEGVTGRDSPLSYLIRAGDDCDTLKELCSLYQQHAPSKTKSNFIVDACFGADVETLKFLLQQFPDKILEKGRTRCCR